MRIGMGFGRLLDRFWSDFWAKLGAKLEPKSTQNRSKVVFESYVRILIKFYRQDSRTWA